MKLEDFYKQVTPKSRLALYLMSHREMSFDRIRQLTVADVKLLAHERFFETNMLTTMESVIDGKNENDRVFSTSSGRPYSIKNLEDILLGAHKRLGVTYQGRAAFVESVT